MSKRPKQRISAGLRRLIAALAVLSAAAALAVWENTALVTEHFPFTHAALPAEFDGLRIVHLSDLHGRRFGPGSARLLAAVEAARPDLIVLTGDLVDQGTADPADYAAETGGGLSAIAPVYYVTGNHEWAGGPARAETIKDALTGAGVTVLSNAFVPVERDGAAIFLAGIDDPNGYADQKSAETLVQELRQAHPDAFWLLAHRNTHFNGRYCRLGAALVLCGHGHGGIWRLPGVGGLMRPDLRLLPDFTDGFYRCGDAGCAGGEVFVSRGLGNSPVWALRLFNRPQVAVLTLRKG